MRPTTEAYSPSMFEFELDPAALPSPEWVPELRTAEDTHVGDELSSVDNELISVLAAAIESGATEVVNAIVGTQLRELGEGNPNHDPANGQFTSGDGASDGSEDTLGFLENEAQAIENSLPTMLPDNPYAVHARKRLVKLKAQIEAMRVDPQGRLLEDGDDLTTRKILNKDLVPPGFRSAGGPGSGNFGHAGRPGEIGGSTDRLTGPADKGAGGASTMVIKWTEQGPDGPVEKVHREDVTDSVNQGSDSEDLLENIGYKIKEAAGGAFIEFTDGKIESGDARDAFFTDLDTAGFRNPMNDREHVIGSEAGVEISATREGLRLHSIRSFATKSGAGSRAMRVVMDLADKHGLTIEGSAKAFKTGQKDTLSSAQLRSWYSKLGFTVKSNGDMVRKPKSVRALELQVLGGPGSGNFGHAGRPGEIGGSAPDGVDNGSEIGKPASAYPILYPDGLDTQERFSDRQGNYTPERTRLHDAIIAKWMRGTTAVEKPLATILGGAPGVGKTTLVKAEGISAVNTVQVSPDDIRNDLPEYAPGPDGRRPASTNFTHEEASDISAKLVREASKNNRNMTLDGTGDSTIEKLGGKVAVMRSRGADVEAVYVTTPVENAQKWADIRSEDPTSASFGRKVPPTAMAQMHKDVSRIFPEAVRQGLFKRARLYDNTEGVRTLVASAKWRTLTIYDQKLWDAFVAKGKQ